MLEVFHAFAVRLIWLRPISVLIVAGFAALFGYAAFSTDAPQSYFTSAIVGICWGLLLFMFLSFFQELPTLPAEQHSLWQRFCLRIFRFGYLLLGFATLGMFVAVFVVTLKAR